MIDDIMAALGCDREDDEEVGYVCSEHRVQWDSGLNACPEALDLLTDDDDDDPAPADAADNSEHVWWAASLEGETGSIPTINHDNL